MRTHLGPFVSEFLAEFEYGRVKVNTHFQRQLICIFKTASKKIPRRGLSNGLPTQATHRHHVWTWDFIFDRTDKGGTLKMMTLLDEYTRQQRHPGRTSTHGDSSLRRVGKGDGPIWDTWLYSQ